MNSKVKSLEGQTDQNKLVLKTQIESVNNFSSTLSSIQSKLMKAPQKGNSMIQYVRTGRPRSPDKQQTMQTVGETSKQSEDSESV